MKIIMMMTMTWATLPEGSPYGGEDKDADAAHLVAIGYQALVFVQSSGQSSHHVNS